MRNCQYHTMCVTCITCFPVHYGIGLVTYSPSASHIKHTVHLVFVYKVFLKVYTLISNPSAARPKNLSVLQNACFK